MKKFTVIDHNTDPPASLEVETFMSEDDFSLEHLAVSLGSVWNKSQIVECRQANAPITDWDAKLNCQIPIDLRILKTWKDVVAFLLSKPAAHAIPKDSCEHGEIDFQLYDTEQLFKFKQLQQLPFVRWIEPRQSELQSAHYELGQTDFYSPRSSVGGRRTFVPFMKEMILSTPSPNYWEFFERKHFIDTFRALLSMFPDSLLTIVYGYAHHQLIQECRALVQNKVRIFVGDASFSLRQALRLSECCNCQKMETDLNKFQRCSQCKRRKYCSRECQKSHWVMHGEQCVQLAALSKTLTDIQVTLADDQMNQHWHINRA